MTAPRTGLCDAASAFPSADRAVSPKWINYTGCDSLYATAADTNTAYFAGHERWADNRNGCNVAGPGAVQAPGNGRPLAVRQHALSSGTPPGHRGSVPMTC